MKEFVVVQSSFLADCLRPLGLQHCRPPCPSPSPRVCSNSCPLGRWYHSTISSSVTSFSCPQSFPASESFPVTQLFASSGQSIEASALATEINPINFHGWFPLGLMCLISLQPQEPSRVFSSTTMESKIESINSSAISLYGPTLTSLHDYWKNHSYNYTDFC